MLLGLDAQPFSALMGMLDSQEDSVLIWEPHYRFRCNCSDLRGSADYSPYSGGATEHGISTANGFRPLKREE